MDGIGAEVNEDLLQLAAIDGDCLRRFFPVHDDDATLIQ